MTDHDAQRVEHMLALAKTRADLQELVRSLDAANVRLRHTIRRLTTPGSEQDPHE